MPLPYMSYPKFGTPRKHMPPKTREGTLSSVACFYSHTEKGSITRRMNGLYANGQEMCYDSVTFCDLFWKRKKMDFQDTAWGWWDLLMQERNLIA